MNRRPGNRRVVVATAGAAAALLLTAGVVLYLFFGVGRTMACVDYVAEDGSAPRPGGCTSESSFWVPWEPHWIVYERH